MFLQPVFAFPDPPGVISLGTGDAVAHDGVLVPGIDGLIEGSGKKGVCMGVEMLTLVELGF